MSQLYTSLTAAGLRVWWDKKCLRSGQKWEDCFVDGMLSSLVIVPVLSAGALKGFEKLTPKSNCDNLFLEKLGCSQAVPHHFGPMSSAEGLFAEGCHVQPPWPAQADRILTREDEPILLN